ncbi:MAG: hypothetical protein EP332_06510 [Bacteroidetes bacterium]|nr:MAG: hypothetical protein EP332_06510 [Bacteroidota bacterium]
MEKILEDSSRIILHIKRIRIGMWVNSILIPIALVFNGEYPVIVKYNVDLWVVGFTYYPVLVYCLWLNWKMLPLTKSQKKDNTWKLIVLGIIGMWLWLPNRKELDAMFEPSTEQKS